MSTYIGSASVREDFRCLLCRQRNVFHCEHDTPYRDQYLGATDQERLEMNPTSGRREAHASATHNGKDAHMSTTNGGRDAHRNLNNHSSTSNHATTNNGIGRIVDTRMHPGAKSKPNPVEKVKAEEEQKKKKSSCVIL